MTQRTSVPEAVEQALRELLMDPSAAVREAASAALDRVRARRDAEVYLERLRSASLEERVRTVHAAREIGGQEGVSILLAALADPEGEVRGAAVRALEDFLSPAVLKALAARLPHESGVVLGNLIEALGKSRRRELGPVIERYLGHADPEVRGKALVAYARVADVPWWEKILPGVRDRAEAVRAQAAAALGEWGAPPKG